MGATMVGPVREANLSAGQWFISTAASIILFSYSQMFLAIFE